MIVLFYFFIGWQLMDALLEGEKEWEEMGLFEKLTFYMMWPAGLGIALREIITTSEHTKLSTSQKKA